MYQIPIFQIRLESDLAEFVHSNLAGTGFDENLISSQSQLTTLYYVVFIF